jgi:pyrophosphatase PpaX
MPYAAVLCDLDGTLIDSRLDLALSVQHGFTAAGLEPPDADRIIENVGKPLEWFPEILGYQAGPEQKRAFAQAFRAYFPLHFRDHTRPFPGVIATLAKMRHHGLKLALVTTKRQDQADQVATEFGLAAYFDVVRGWWEGRQHKPHPEPLLEAASTLGCRPEETLMVGDSEQDLLAAHSAGMDSCACLYGFRRPDYLRSLLPTHTIKAFPELLDTLGLP